MHPQSSEYVSDELWALVSPLIPKPTQERKGPQGRPRVSDRRALNGIVFVLITGISWRHLPLRLGWGSGVTCWRRLRDWQEAGVWDQMHRLCLARLRATGVLDLHRVILDSTSVRAVKGGKTRGQTPRIAGKEAANNIIWSTPAGFRLWLQSRPQTFPMSSRSKR
jgi:transposase